MENKNYDADFLYELILKELKDNNDQPKEDFETMFKKYFPNNTDLKEDEWL